MTHDEMKAVAHRLFKTADGELLMQYLKERYYDNKISDENLERQIGQRDVVWSILKLLEIKNVPTKAKTK